MPQLAFAWPSAEHYATEDFIISDANSLASTFLEQNFAGAALLSGPPFSGKTHLACIWQRRTDAARIDPHQLGKVASAELWAGKSAALLEQCELLTDQDALFHLLRHAESHQAPLLLTSRLTAAEMPFTLPDLRSRFAAFPGATLQVPDAPLLHAFLAKSFADRQLRVGEETVEFILKRAERSFGAIVALVEAAERIVFETKREITIPLIKTLLVKS